MKHAPLPSTHHGLALLCPWLPQAGAISLPACRLIAHALTAGLLGLGLITLHTSVRAQDGGAAAAALKILTTPTATVASGAAGQMPPASALVATPTGTTVTGMPATASPHALGGQPAMAMPSGPGVVTVQRGDTLDRVIRRTLGETPFSDAFLRKAFVQLNPHAFRASGNPNLISAGSTLHVPTAAQLQQLMHAHYPHSAAVQGAGHDSTTAHATDAEARKRWVRYP